MQFLLAVSLLIAIWKLGWLDQIQSPVHAKWARSLWGSSCIKLLPIVGKRKCYIACYIKGKKKVWLFLWILQVLIAKWCLFVGKRKCYIACYIKGRKKVWLFCGCYQYWLPNDACLHFHFFFPFFCKWIMFLTLFLRMKELRLRKDQV